MKMRFPIAIFVPLCLALVATVSAQHKINNQQMHDENQDALKQLSLIKKPKGIEAQLFASEPNVKNPVALFIDHKGRVFVCESFRQEEGIEDNRSHMHWLHDDLAAQTVEDRLAYIRKHLGDKANEYTTHDDQIRQLIDRDGDGKADSATVFSKGYNEIVSGTGAGVLHYRDQVYFTCIPDLWLLRDDNRDGVADIRQKLHTGFGVRFAFRGHDMHGLVIGPDGRLYFSIGDRGYNVKTDSKQWVNPESGAVFRCELDGSNFEVIHTGLRNPQELAFDNYGNLFTGDNNSDSGDKARLVYVVPGGDSGWRMSYQYLSDRGPFNREKIWHPFHGDTPAYMVPPVTNLADGPSGLTFYPGTGFGDRFKDRFFLCDFRGQSSNSGIRSFRVENDGAFFKVVDMEQPFWQVLATDADFGPDGKLYVSDWVHGWVGEKKGRIYTFSDPAHRKLANEVRDMLSKGFTDRSNFFELLAHPDRRIRQEAQFEAVRLGRKQTLIHAAEDSSHQLRRVHAIFGLGQFARKGDVNLDDLKSLCIKLLADDDPEIQYQVMQLISDAKLDSLSSKIAEHLAHRNLRVRYGAALCLGRLQSVEHSNAIFEMIAQNSDKDPMVRHAGIMALTWIADHETLSAAINHPSASVRIAAVVAMRNLSLPGVSGALSDPNPNVVLEAARAIHDLPIQSELPKLANLINSVSGPAPLLRRVANANYRLGTIENAKALVNLATNPAIETGIRLDSLKMLESWNQPGPLDWVLGMWRPIEQRETIDMQNVFKAALPKLLATSGDITTEALRIAAKLNIRDIQPLLSEILFDVQRNEHERAAALKALIAIKSDHSQKFIEMSLSSESNLIRACAIELAADHHPKPLLPHIQSALKHNSVRLQQSAIRALAKLNSKDAISLIQKLAIDMRDKKSQAALDLDIWQLVQARKDDIPVVYHQLIAQKEQNPNFDYQFSANGGDFETGREIFFQRTTVSCLRCHVIDGKGGEVGPDLSDIGAKQNRQYLLDAILDPNKEIAKDFETVAVLDIDGRTHTGTLKSDTDESVTLITAEGNRVTIKQDDIEDMVKTKSSMPEDLKKHLSPSDVRDLVEFLALQKKKNE